MTRIVKATEPASSLPPELLLMLPDQGSIELQRDQPGKIHDFHRHSVDEVLYIIKGALTFTWDEGACLCEPGDRIQLPAGTLHKSEAAESGAVYAILTLPSSPSYRPDS